MREWMREKMRRRSKRGPNDSESTGKIGQEIPANQPAPLRPSYEAAPVSPLSSEAGSPTPEPDAPEPATETPTTIHHSTAGDEPEAEITPIPADVAAAVGDPEEQGKLVVETQPDSPSIPPPEPLAAGATSGDARTPKGYVVLTIGLPGSGKTTWFKRRGVTPLSSDMLRSILFDDITEQRYQGLVFSTLRSLLRARLIAKMPWNYVDATNLSPHERRQWIKMAKSFGYDVQAVFFDVPLEICMERNSRRERTVSDDVMKKMAERLRAPNFKEGFSKIVVVRVKNPAATETPVEGA